MSLRIEREEITAEVVGRLIAGLNTELTRQYPEDGANHFRLDPEEVSPGRGSFLVAYEDDGSAAGCGAVRLLAGGDAEVKRMFVVAEARGRGHGRTILEALEREARSLGATRLVLETGERQVEALRLYESAGFSRIARFGEYVNSPLSVCMAKELGRDEERKCG